jgi:hypothetical protein
MASEEPANIPVTVQLVKYKPVPWVFRHDLPEPPVTTPSQWFSKRWPQEADAFGTPFLEATFLDGDLEKHVNPIAINEIFFASILAGNETMGHKVIYYTPDEEFYVSQAEFAGKRVGPQRGKRPVYRPKNGLRRASACGHHSVPLPADAPAIHGPKRKTHPSRS